MEWLRELLKSNGQTVRDGNFRVELHRPLRSIECKEQRINYETRYVVELETYTWSKTFDLHYFEMTSYLKFDRKKVRNCTALFTITDFKDICKVFVTGEEQPSPRAAVGPSPVQQEEEPSHEEGDDDQMEYDSDGWEVYDYSGQDEEESPPQAFQYQPVDETPAPEPTKECVVCMDPLSWRIVFVPCGHACVCQECAQRVETCPTCRAHIGQKLKLFL